MQVFTNDRDRAMLLMDDGESVPELFRTVPRGMPFP
jgi:hypothetical protein